MNNEIKPAPVKPERAGPRDRFWISEEAPLRVIAVPLGDVTRLRSQATGGEWKRQSRGEGDTPLEGRGEGPADFSSAEVCRNLDRGDVRQ